MKEKKAVKKLNLKKELRQVRKENNELNENVKTLKKESELKEQYTNHLKNRYDGARRTIDDLEQKIQTLKERFAHQNREKNEREQTLKKNHTQAAQEYHTQIKELSEENQRLQQEVNRVSSYQKRTIVRLQQSLEDKERELEELTTEVENDKQARKKWNEKVELILLLTDRLRAIVKELTTATKVEVLSDRKYKLVFASQEVTTNMILAGWDNGKFDFRELEKMAYGDEIRIEVIPENVDIFNPIEIIKDNELRKFVEVFAGDYQLEAAYASAIREAIKHEGTIGATKRYTDAELTNLKESGKTYRQISKITGSKEGTVKARISKFRKQQREERVDAQACV